MPQKIFIREHSREYSLFRLGSWYNSMGENISKIIGKGVEEACAVYDGKDLVDLYYEPNNLKDVFNAVVEKCQSEPKLMEQEISNFLNLFHTIKPYYDGKEKIKDEAEFKKVFLLYLDIWMYTAIIFIIPNLPVEDSLKKIAFEAREKTQEYNESVENVFKEFINNKYSELKDYSRFILPEEVWNNKIRNNEETKKNILERSKGYILYKNKIYIGKQEDILNDLNIVLSHGSNTKDDSLEIKGQIACKGIAKGKVKIVSSMKDVADFEQDQVLVSSMTMPKYLPAMKKASAFITDEGGITCHAAIVSREMKKPCVIGTKNATKILKDGDIVAIDADKGIIKILNKK